MSWEGALTTASIESPLPLRQNQPRRQAAVLIRSTVEDKEGRPSAARVRPQVRPWRQGAERKALDVGVIFREQPHVPRCFSLFHCANDHRRTGPHPQPLSARNPPL